MLRLYIKTYNSSLLNQLIYQFRNNLKFKNLVNFTLLPPKRKNFVVKKSPHVFGRSKEKYYLKTYSCVILFKYIRKKDLISILKMFRFFKYREGLGFKFIIF